MHASTRLPGAPAKSAQCAHAAGCDHWDRHGIGDGAGQDLPEAATLAVSDELPSRRGFAEQGKTSLHELKV